MLNLLIILWKIKFEYSQNQLKRTCNNQSQKTKKQVFIYAIMSDNPNTFAGLVGKVRKNYLPKEEGREGGEKKHAQRARRTQG